MVQNSTSKGHVTTHRHGVVWKSSAWYWSV